MLDQFETKNLFQLQAELIDRKIDMAAARSIDKVIEQISLLRIEVREELKQSRAETSKEFEKVREELKQLSTETSKNFEKVREELKQSSTETSKEFEKVREELKQSSTETSKEFEKVREELKQLSTETSKNFEKVKENLQQVGQRVVAIETKLGIVTERQKDIKSRFFDYLFKTGWLILTTSLAFALLHAQLIIK